MLNLYKRLPLLAAVYGVSGVFGHAIFPLFPKKTKTPRTESSELEVCRPRKVPLRRLFFASFRTG
jgi:hypothetical protein